MNAPQRMGAVYKLAMWDRLQEEYRIRGDELFEIGPLLLPIYVCLQNDLIVGFSRIFERQNRSKGNIHKFLSHARAHHTKIQNADSSLSREIVDRHIDELRKHAKTIDLITNRRDQYVAHMDLKYLENPEKLDEDFPLKFDELRQLINTAMLVVGEHEEWLTGKRHFQIAEFANAHMANMVAQLERGRKIDK